MISNTRVVKKRGWGLGDLAPVSLVLLVYAALVALPYQGTLNNLQTELQSARETAVSRLDAESSRDQLRIARIDGDCQPNGLVRDLGIEPMPLAEALHAYGSRR